MKSTSSSHHRGSGLVRKRRKRTVISEEQLRVLERSFKHEQWPSRASKQQLATQLNINEQFVNIWFQNKRARIKREEELRRLAKVLEDKAKDGSPSSSSGKAKKSPVKILPAPTSVSSSNTIIGHNKAVHCKTLKAERRHNAIKQSTTMTPQKQSLPSSSYPKVSAEVDRRQVSSTPNLFHSTIAMIAIIEGGIITPRDPEFGPAVNDALYGIVINGSQRLVYDKESGLDLVDMEPL